MGTVFKLRSMSWIPSVVQSAMTRLAVHVSEEVVVAMQFE